MIPPPTDGHAFMEAKYRGVQMPPVDTLLSTDDLPSILQADANPADIPNDGEHLKSQTSELHDIPFLHPLMGHGSPWPQDIDETAPRQQGSIREVTRSVVPTLNARDRKLTFLVTCLDQRMEMVLTFRG
jgi:hypothetical protein